MIKKRELKKIELDSQESILVIEFRQAMIYKSSKGDWKLKEIWNNSRIKLSIKEPSTVEALKQKLETPELQNGRLGHHFELEKGGEQRYTVSFNFGIEDPAFYYSK